MVLERALSNAGYEVETAAIISSGTVIRIDGLPNFNTLKKEEKGRTGAFETKARRQNG